MFLFSLCTGEKINKPIPTHFILLSRVHELLARVCNMHCNDCHKSLSYGDDIVDTTHVSPFLNGWQHGFVKGRSCITQLVLTHHMWHKALDDGLQVDAVFLDFAKAFDRVHHKILLNKLCNFGISWSLLEWCSDYLSNRTQRVVIDGNCSSWLNILSGVPQGSILGPLFYVIFISDLPEVVSVREYSGNVRRRL